MGASAQRGTTLLEVLIAISITAMIMAAGAAALKQGTDVVVRLSEATMMTEDQAVFERTLRELTRGALWIGLDEEKWRFEGSPQRFSMVGFDGQGEIIRTTVEILPTGKINLAVRQVTEGDALLLDTSFQLSKEPIELRYLTAEDTNLPKWSDGISGSRPPLLISIGSFSSTASSYRVDLDLPPRSPVLCNYDPVSRVCRGTVG